MSASLALVAALSTLFAGGVIDSKEYQDHGFERHFSLARDPWFRSVGMFRQGARASGVWFYRGFVLTTADAAFRPDGTLYAPAEVEFVIPDEFGNELAFRGASWFIPKGYLLAREAEDESAAASMNVAILRLDERPAPFGIDPAILGFELPMVGADVVLNGFGQRGLLKSGPRVTEFGAGYGDEPIRALAFRGVVSLAGVSPASDLPGVATRGDEGGAVFFRESGEWRLSGIIQSSQSQETRVLWLSPFSRQILKGVVQGSWSDFLDMKTP
mgnify:FL=1